MLMWVWIAVVVVALVILGVAAGRLVGRLGPLGRAVVKLQHRREEVAALQAVAEDLQETVADLERRSAQLARNRK